MKTRSHRILILPVLITACAAAVLSGCALRPEKPIPAASQPPVFIIPSIVPTSTPVPTVQPTAEQPDNCTNGLSFLSDINIPDGTHVDPGTVISKQWQVQNSGTCNWNNLYSLQLTGGDPLGAAGTQAPIPARGGSEAILQITFTAPQEPGKYSSSWSAFDPQGNPFGDPVFIEINVNAP